MGLNKISFRLITLLTYLLIGNAYSLDIKDEESNLKILCKDSNERGCYKLANFYERHGYTVVREKKKIRSKGRGLKEALKIYRRQCKDLGFEDNNGYKSCQKLEGGSEEIFLGAPYRGKIKRYIKTLIFCDSSIENF